MAYRFSRRIKICKGVHLNVSKSGVGISLGARGASISTGPRGSYINLGLPGTGLSYRKKISGDDNNNQKFLSEADVKPRGYITGSELRIQIDNDGKELVYMEAPDGTTFVDEEMMRRVKRSDAYKEMLEITRKTKFEVMKQKNDSCIDIYKSAEKLITEEDVINEKNNTESITQQYYVMRSFDEPEPIITKRYEEAHSYALETVKTKKFWKKTQLINEATQNKMQELHSIDMQKWEKRRDEFLEFEKNRKAEKDAEYKKEYEQNLTEREKTYDLILNPNEEYLLDTIGDVLGQIELPVDFSVDFSVQNNNIELDVDLPEIEDFPQKTCSILSSGKLSIKNKTITDMNKDYATGVVGMSFYFSSLLFNISPKIEKISISGYTQRVNKKTGNIDDQYVYSVTFTRKEFSELNIQNIDPLQAITSFTHKMDITSKFELRTIEVEKSYNRNTDEGKQKVLTEYYTVDYSAKEPEVQIIEKPLTTLNETTYQKQINNASNNNDYIPQKQENKIGKGCLVSIIIGFILMLICCVTCLSGGNDYSEYANGTGKGKLLYDINHK